MNKDTMISDSIRAQSKQIFQNIEYIFAVLNDQNINSRIGVFPIWKQLYHLLHSIDQNFFDPGHFSDPPFHTKNLNVIFLESPESLNRDQLYLYFQQVRAKVETYLTTLNDSVLKESIIFRDMKLTKMELILAQFRHIFYHIGYLHCCFKQLNGETPRYAGLYEALPEK